MYSVTGNTTSLVLGFPIRTSSDQSSVDSSPRLIAASNVLHRLPVPRHPPCALKHLQHKKPDTEKKKLHHNKPHTDDEPNSSPAADHPALRREPRNPCGLMLATTIHKSNTTLHHQDGATTRNHQPKSMAIPHRTPTSAPGRPWACCLRTQQCVWWHQPAPRRTGQVCLSCTHRASTTDPRLKYPNHTQAHRCGGGGNHFGIGAP